MKLDHMGDFLLAIPAMSKIRCRFPHAKIHVLVGSWNSELARKTKSLDRVIEFDYFKKKII